jgi:spore germination protein GerM
MMYSTEFTVKIVVNHYNVPPTEMIRSLLNVPAVESVEITEIKTDYQLFQPPLPERVEQFNIPGTGLWEKKHS